MQQADFDDFSTILQVVAEYFGKPLSAGVIAIYWQGLNDLDLSAVRRALNAHVQNPDSGQFMPKIADIRRMLGGTTQDAALVAWSAVDRAVRQVGPYADVVFDDPLIHRVLHDMGGWIGLGLKSEEEWPFVGREFENRYRGFRMRSERPEYPRVLVGMVNADRAKQGLATEPPRLVGDPQRCMAVLEGGTDRPLLGFSTVGEAAPKAAHGLRVIEGRKSA